MPSLSMNVVKRVDRLPKPRRTSDALQPLFEAISNSIQSTQQKFGTQVSKMGRIEVTVRSPHGRKPLLAVVEDNGIGLDERNYEAFKTTDTDNKIEIGGKGVGRLLWLDCFEKIHVESTYREIKDSRHRSFDFRLSQSDQIQNLHDRTVSGRDSGMTVTFEGLRDNGYRDKFPVRLAYVFQHLASHFLPIFIGKKSPQVVVHCDDETRDYPNAIGLIIKRRDDFEDIETAEFGKLSLTLMECDKVASADLTGNHFVHFIAHDRTVKSQPIDAKLGFKYFGDTGDRVFHACVFGRFLDRHVTQERTGFTFEEGIIERIVNEVCMPRIEKFLPGPMAELKQEQDDVISRIIETYPSVAFGSNDELRKYVPLGEVKGDAIYGHLSRQRFRRDQVQAERVRSVLARLRGGDLDVNALTNAIAEASNAIDEAERKSLAEYVVRRKAVLDFMELLLRKVRDDKRDSAYQREEILHSFICPVRTKTVGSSQRITPAASHDLWIIDERLTFAQYFSSDVPFTELIGEKGNKSGKARDDRADLLIFDKVHGLRQTETPSKVLLVEFKRPGRKTYTEGENPHLQVERYIKKLLGGGETDVAGRPIRLSKDTVFYCFIVADPIGRMDEWTYSWSRTPDGRGKVYQPRDGFNGSIELISWDALLQDARERNRAFFDRAGISGRSLFSDS